MTDQKSDDGGRDEKAERLAERLRENLKRRKAQARAHRSEEAGPQQPEPSAQADDRRT